MHSFTHYPKANDSFPLSLFPKTAQNKKSGDVPQRSSAGDQHRGALTFVELHRMDRRVLRSGAFDAQGSKARI
jgi:hypothetical protein